MANIVLIPNELSGLNYSISPSVASNNLTLAIKDAAGANPTSTSPCVFRVGGSERILSTSLSVTKNAGTNWANLGGSEIATKEADLFVYIVWNTNTSALDVLWSRIPYATLYSDFSATTTNEKYGAINATAPASTDNVVNIGRFAATLGATASFNWSVPTYTSANLRHQPTFETRWTSYQPTFSANGSMTYTTVTTTKAVYQIRNNNCEVWVSASGTTGGTASNLLLLTVPFDALYASLTPSGYGNTSDASSTAARVFMAAGTPDLIACAKYDTSNFALAAGKTMNIKMPYEI